MGARARRKGIDDGVVVGMSYTLRANTVCPSCERDTLAETPDEIVDYRCAVCGERVREGDL